MHERLYWLSLVAISISLSCGGSDDLGYIGEEPITTGEYMAVFNNLPAEEQVAVLEPGGRMELMNRIVRKRLLLAAWEEDRTVSLGWEDLYSTSMLADSMFNRIGRSYDYEAFIDSLSSCGYSGFSLRVVLLDDSAAAAGISDLWNSGNFDSSIPSLSAPWSLANGSSYRNFTGPVHRITTPFLPLLSMETGTAQLLPMYGEWCVCILNLAEGEWIREEGVEGLGFMNAVSDVTREVILSKGISALASFCEPSGTRLLPVSPGSDQPVVLFSSDTLTVADILEIMRKADPANFGGSVSPEIAPFSPPELFMTPEATLWFYVKSVAERYCLAQLALEQGIILPDNALDYARAESVVRSRVLESTVPDSLQVTAWYEDNRELFLLPEMRAVFLGYTDSTSAADSEIPADFDRLPNYQTILDENRVMIPTPLQVELAFGPVLGPAIFSADSGVFTGPVFPGGELAAWFKVVEIAPPAIASLDEVYSDVVSMATLSMFEEGFNSLVYDLYGKYSVTVDTAAVLEIDLWGESQ
jgi:hypothetical protein